MSQTTNAEQLKFNIMTEEQFNLITPSPSEFYMLVDASNVTEEEILRALGYTPYNASNPAGYISSASVNSLTDVSLSSVTNDQALLYNTTTQKWENKNIVTSTAWGGITGTLADQTDLQQALNGKQPTITGAATTITSNDLTAGRALISDNSGKVATSSITTAKLGYLSDVTSNIQVQINGKYDASNPAGYISGITSEDVITALGFTPYSASNPEGYTSNVGTVTSVNNVEPDENGNITLSIPGSPTWGGISGTLSNQTDLQQALNAKYDASNPAGYISGITSSDVTTALGFTPYDASNPAGYTSNVGTVTSVNNISPVNGNVVLSIPAEVTESTVAGWGFTKNTGTVRSVNNVSPDLSGNVTLEIPDTATWGNISGTLSNQTDLQAALNSKYDSSNPAGYITGISSSDVTTALGYTPYDSSNPAGYTSNVGTVTSVNNISPVNGNVTLEIPDTATWGNISGTLSNQTDLQQALNAKYDASNPAGYISSASVNTLTDVTLTNVADGEVLRYNATSQKWENSASGGGSSTLEDLTDVKITSPTQGQNLTYDAVNNKWINTTTTATVGWGGITGNINDQTDLKNALDSKASVTFRDWSVS